MRTTKKLLMLLWATMLIPIYSSAQNSSGHSIVLCANGEVSVFGRNQTYQLGLNSNTPNVWDYPQTNPYISNAVGVATGITHSLAVLDDGTVLAWGSNAQGCSGQPFPSTVQVVVPTAVSLPGCAVAVAAGNSFSLALLADGTIWAWGYDAQGQLGNGTGDSSGPTAVQVSGITTAVAISAGADHGIALLADGTVRTWGHGDSGRLGDGSTSNQFAPVTVASSSGTLTDVVKIDGGETHTVALRGNGDVYTWGSNFDGQLGLGVSPSQSALAMLSTDLSAGTEIDIAAGGNYTMVLNSGGSTIVCGANTNRQLGFASPSTPQYTPLAGPTIPNAIDITIPPGALHGWAITNAGLLYTWGYNLFGQVGNGTSGNNVSPPASINTYGCTAKPTPDNHPQPCCVAIREGERAELEGTYASGGVINYSGQNLAITGPITLASGNHYLTNCDVVCTSDASITVNNGARLYIQSGSHLYACDEMWQGIDVKNGARIYFLSSSIIEDAEVAIDLEYGALYSINTAIFNRNFQHFYKHMPPSGSPVNTGSYRIVKSKFLCQTTASIGLPTPVHQNLLAPHQNERTLTQAMAIGVPDMLVGNTLANANTFDNASWFGVMTDGVSKVEILYNKFKDVGYCGNYITNTPTTAGTTININYNSIDRSQYPIYCYDNSYRVRTHITYNTINFAGMSSPPAFMTGITVEEITPASGNAVNDEYNYVDVSHNNIYNAPCGINLRNMLGNRTSPTAKLYVGDNTITHSKPNSDWQAGIKTDYVSEVAISNNTISHPGSSTNWWEASIRISNGSHNSATCNNTSHHGSGIVTDNDIRPNSHFVRNNMTAHDNGLFMNYSIIGNQGTTAEPFDNQWLGSWPSGKDHIECYGSSSDGTQSPFTVRSSGSTYYPANRTGTSFGTAVPTPSTTSNTWPHGCQYTAPSFKTDGGELSPAAEALNIIQGDAEVQTEMDEAMNWNARFNLYRSLQYDEELLFADDALQVFASEQDNGNIGKLYRAMTAYGNIELANEGAALDLQSVNPQNRPEQTLKEVLEVLTANDLSQLSDENESMLRDAALRCPIDDGFGVYIARSALLKIDTLPKNYVSDCELIPSPEQTSEKQQLDALSGFAVYPNPSVNTLFVEYNLKTEEQGEVRIHGIAGNLVWSKAIGSDTDRLEIDLAGISSGVYLLSIEVNGERKLSERVSVLRP